MGDISVYWRLDVISRNLYFVEDNSMSFKNYDGNLEITLTPKMLGPKFFKGLFEWIT